MTTDLDRPEIEAEPTFDFDLQPETSIKFYAAGVQFREGWRANLGRVEEGEELLLTPEPTNKYDKFAVQIHSLDGVFLGYAPAKTEKNRWILNALAEGQQLKAIALEVYTEGNAWQALLIEIKPVDEPKL